MTDSNGAAPREILDAYAATVRHIPTDPSDDLVAAHLYAYSGRAGRRLTRLAERIHEQAYTCGRIDRDDQVAGADRDVADLADVVAAANGTAGYVAVAVLMFDLLGPGEFEDLTGWYAAADGWLPNLLRVQVAPTTKVNRPAGPAKYEVVEPTEVLAAPVRTRTVTPPPGVQPTGRLALAATLIPSPETPTRQLREPRKPAAKTTRRRPLLVGRATLAARALGALIAVEAIAAIGILMWFGVSLAGIGVSPAVVLTLLALDVAGIVATVIARRIQLHRR